jgi:sulfur-oxidizing protein SoxY
VTVQRRAFLAGATAVSPLVSLVPFSAQATPDALAAAIKDVTGDAPLREGKVTLDVPPLVENGNTVPLSVTVDSPMTADDHVKAIHVFNEKNPQPHVFNAWLSPANGRAFVATRIKLADAQRVVAVAETSRGEFWTAHAEVIVTIAACIEDIT